jgi:hypothetical protein
MCKKGEEGVVTKTGKTGRRTQSAPPRPPRRTLRGDWRGRKRDWEKLKQRKREILRIVKRKRPVLPERKRVCNAGVATTEREESKVGRRAKKKEKKGAPKVRTARRETFSRKRKNVR